jgi:DNA-binding transcriptional ArsR family regulator
MAADAVFDALGDPTRRQILRALSSGAKPVGALADELPVRRPAVSKHLRVLQGAGLVSYEAHGTRHLYALAPEGYVAAQQWFVETWDSVLQAFAAHLEQEQS